MIKMSTSAYAISLDKILEDKNMVIISKSDYDEFLRLKNNAEYLAKIDRGIEQMEKGLCQQHDIIEVD